MLLTHVELKLLAFVW